MAARVEALALCDVSATPPANNAAPHRHSGATAASGSVSQQRCRRWTDEGVKHIPNRIHVGNLVGKKFDEVECCGDTDNLGMREDLQRGWQMNDLKALQQSESNDGGIKVETG